jgi:CO dehydrogenase maturation factor
LSAREDCALETMARQRAVLDMLAEEAELEADAVSQCRAWLATERQAHTYLRHLANRTEPGGSGLGLSEMDDHRLALEGHAARARGEEDRFDDPVRRQARAALGLRVAVIGKGGAGKTFVAATLARQLARRGRRVLAVDLDTNPGLALSIGVAPTAGALPREALEERDGANYGWQLARGLSPRDVVDRFSAQGPDGVRVLALGKIRSVDKADAKRSVTALLHVLLGFGWPNWDVIADLEAGPTTPFERYHAFAQDVIVMVDPAWRSALTARRLLPMVSDQRKVIVANRVRRERDDPGLPAQARIPFDAEVAAAERRGAAPIEACPEAPAVRAVGDLAAQLLSEEAA